MYPTCENQIHPLREVVDRRRDAAGRGLGIGVALKLGLVLVADQRVGDGAVGVRHVVGEARTGVGHAQRPVERVLAQGCPIGSCCDGDGFGRRGDAEVGVRVVDPKVGRLDGLLRQLAQDVLLPVAEVFEDVTRVKR